MLPAYAGMILILGSTTLPDPSAPRVCGDDPVREVAIDRGSLVLPAYAGMIRDHVHNRLRDGCAPRVCGDDPTISVARIFGIPCSPRMRG